MGQAKIDNRDEVNASLKLCDHQINILNITKTWIGTPYHHQSSLKQVGCDCLGLVRGVYEELYKKQTAPIQPYSKDWAEQSKQETLIEAANEYLDPVTIKDRQTGDILIFRFRKWTIAKHAAIQSAENRMIHAIEGAVVEEVHLNNWWQRHIAAVFRFPKQF